jgi:hypothetical protein
VGAPRLLLGPDEEFRNAVLCSANIERRGPIKVKDRHPVQDSPQILEKDSGPRITPTRSGQPRLHCSGSNLKAALRDDRDSFKSTSTVREGRLPAPIGLVQSKLLFFNALAGAEPPFSHFYAVRSCNRVADRTMQIGEHFPASPRARR